MNSVEEKYLYSYLQEIREEGKKLLDSSLPELREEDFFLYQKTGNRLIYEGEYFGRRKFLTVFGILTECDNNQIYVDKLSEILLEVCKEKYWALPAHVNFDALNENTIDLFAAETAQTLAEMAELFEDRLPENVIFTMIDEVIGRVMKPFCESKAPYSWWEEDSCNWSAVCAGSIGMAAIHLAHLQEKKKKYQSLFCVLPVDWKENCIKRVLRALDCYLSGMEEDGTCTEGLGYFSYGMSYFTGFAEMLYEESQHEINLMEQQKCKKIAEFQQKCYFGNGISLSFSDADAKECFLPGLTAYLAYMDEKVEIPDYALARYFHQDTCYRWLTNERNISWLRKYSKAEERNTCSRGEKVYLLPSAQWMIWQDEKGNGYAVKGGHNAENHNHNDVGHFLCVVNGEMLLTDLGAGEYTKDYFHEGRYGILCNRSLGHSVPLINGMEQCEGREYKAESFQWNAEERSVSVSFASAYPMQVIDKIERKMTGTIQDGLILTDTFCANENTREIIENIIATVKPQMTEHIIVLTGKKSVCEIQVDIDGKQQQHFEVIPYEHSQHDGTKVTVYGIQWRVTVQKGQNISCHININLKSR